MLESCAEGRTGRRRSILSVLGLLQMGSRVVAVVFVTKLEEFGVIIGHVFEGGNSRGFRLRYYKHFQLRSVLGGENYILLPAEA